AMTVLPAALALLGSRVNSLSVWSLLRRPAAAGAEATAEGGFWYRVSHFSMRRPVPVLLVAVVALLVLGIPFLSIRLGIGNATSLPQGSESRLVTEMLTTSFPANETEPIQVVVH